MELIVRDSYTRIFKEIYIKLFLNICGFNKNMEFLYEVLLSYSFACARTFMWIVFTSRYEMKMGQICVDFNTKGRCKVVHAHAMKSYGGVEVLLHPLLTLVLSGGEWSALCPSWFAPWDQTVFVSTLHIETIYFYSYMKCFSQPKFYTFEFFWSPELDRLSAPLSWWRIVLLYLKCVVCKFWWCVQ